MQHQIDAAAAEVGQLEEKILVNMMEADEINATIKKADAALKAAQAKVSAERAAIEADVTVQQGVAAECAAARARVVAAMDDKGVVDTFMRIAKVRGTAVARAEGERCTVCQVRLRPVVFVSVIKNDQIVQCDSCNRILYFVPPPAKPAAPAAASAAPGGTSRVVITAYFDGGSRGNPGPAGWGAFIVHADGTVLAELSRRAGHRHQQRGRVSRPDRRAAVGRGQRRAPGSP